MNQWSQVSVKMPLRIAKFGLSMIDSENLIIAGGLLMETADQDQDYSGTDKEAKTDPSYC